MEEVKEVEIQNSVGNQEVDYKAEYERMVSEKEREEVVSSFRKNMADEGYVFDEEGFSGNCSKYSNEELKKFEEMFKVLKPQSQRGFVIGAPGPKQQYSSPPKATFQDYINRNKK